MGFGPVRDNTTERMAYWLTLATSGAKDGRQVEATRRMSLNQPEGRYAFSEAPLEAITF